MLPQIDWQTAKLATASIGFVGVSLANLHSALQVIALGVSIVAGVLAIAVSLKKLRK